jgi:predicted Zn-dependent protease
MLTRDEARRICDTVLSLTGPAETIVTLRSITDSHARFADNNLTTSGRADDLEVRIEVWIQGRRGSASSNDPSPAALAAAVAAARLIAGVSPPDREYVGVLGPTEYAPSRGYAESTADLSLETRGRALAAVLEACRSADVIGAGFHDAQGETIATATSGGNFRYFPSTQADLSVTARAEDGTGSGYFARDHFDVGRLDHTRIVEQAIEKSQRSAAPGRSIRATTV